LGHEKNCPLQISLYLTNSMNTYSHTDMWMTIKYMMFNSNDDWCMANFPDSIGNDLRL